MQPEITGRRFSMRKHLSGHWRTKNVSAANPLMRWCVKELSFKHRELDIFAKQCQSFATIADFGAGNGSYSIFFLEQCGATVVAIDWTYQALRSIPAPRRGTLLRLCADLHCLPIKSGCIDGLFSIDVIGHLRHQEQALDEINRICRSGAPLFLHSECSDYRQRLPDRLMIKKSGGDPIAELDGHIGIRSSRMMRLLYEQRFSLIRFFSPAGILGWLLGYPEKYWRPLLHSRLFVFALLSATAALLKKVPGLKLVFRLVNMCGNRIELFLGITGGGSCFAQCRCIVPEPHGGGVHFPSIDIIIPTFRHSPMLQSALDALVSQCTADDRIFIVWQGKTPPQVTGNAPVYLLHRTRPNLPAARNTGLAAGGNPIVLFLDDDCTITPGLLDAHRASYADLSTGAVGGYVDDPLFSSESISTPSWFDITTGELQQHFNFIKSGLSISVMGTNMSFRRSAIEAIGGFDQHYLHNAIWEEIDASFRLLHRAYAIHFCASAKITHHRLPDGGCRADRPFRHLFHLFANTAYFACTFARMKDVHTWIRYWKYRLEYLSRIPEAAPSESQPRHDVRLVIAGLTGAVCGMVRFFIHGTRRGLPSAVIDQYTHTQESLR